MVYKSLLKRYKDQSSTEIFAHFPYNKNNGENWESPFTRLAGMVKAEKWNYDRQEFQDENRGSGVPILINYLNYTFLRLVEENKIAYSQEGDKACINTGLQSRTIKVRP